MANDAERAAREAARKEAERAREEARRVREEAQRLRHEARDMERRLRQEDRRRKHDERRGQRGGSSAFPFAPLDPPPGPGTGGSDGEETIHEPIGLDGVRAITVDQTAGKVYAYLCGEGEEPAVITTSKANPKVELKRNGDRLTIEVHLQRGWIFRKRQGATTHVRLMPGFEDFRVNLGYGEIEMRDLDCRLLQAEVGAGEIRTVATSGTLDAHVGAGKVQLHSHRGLARCETGTGDVSMDIAKIGQGEYRGNVGMGRIELRLPGGHEVFIKATSGIGKARIEYPQGAEGSPVQVRLETGIGEAVVRQRATGDEPAPASTPVGTAKPQRGPKAAAARRREAEEMRVLQLLEQGRISSQEAADLIAALQGASFTPIPGEDAYEGAEDAR